MKSLTLTVIIRNIIRTALSVGIVAVCFTANAQPAKVVLRGSVFDTENHPLPFATVSLTETNFSVAADSKGAFRMPLPNHGLDSVVLVFSYVNKQQTRRVVRKADFNKEQRVTLTDLSLSLKDVEVEARRENAHSVSSIVFDREAIIQSQAFSLADIMNKLPGKLTTAPALQSPQTLTLRTSAAGMNAISNSFGIAIYIDGVRISNDADMQSRSLSMWGATGSVISSNIDGRSYDVTFNGFDLRDIPIERIERIEVIQGVADARYGEMTSGAILITTRAGRTPANISVNLNGGSVQLTGSKGILLSKKWGALNISGGYTYANADPRISVKSYSRINSSAQWTVNLSKNIRNTLSFGYDTRLDDVKQDPDDDSRRATLEKGHTLSINNRFNWEVGRGFINRVSAGISYSKGRQETYNQWLLNGFPKGIADKDTTGVYEGYFIPGAYLAVEQVIGIPISVNANLDFDSRSFFTGNVMHRVSFGGSASVSGNKGPGIIVDPTKPRWVDIANQTQRPVNFDRTLPYLTNTGYYLQDNLSGKIGNRKYTAALGVRIDIQNGFATVQPRLSTTLTLSKNWSVSLAYGTATKAPSMAYRYPAPSWMDIPVLNLYNGNTNESLFLVYTKKIETDNSRLRAARSQSFELGINNKNKWGRFSIIAYARRNTDGLNSYRSYEPLYVPNYGYTIDPATKRISYYAKGDSTMYAGIARYVITNGLYTADYGVELMAGTNEIKALSTSFSLRSAFSYSVYDARGDREVVAVADAFILQGKPAYFGVYQPKKNSSYALTSTLSSITHIPKLGFVVNISADIVMLRATQNDPRSNDPVAYIDRKLQYIEINPADVSKPEYDYLRQLSQAEVRTTLPFMYTCINVSITKEIAKKMRLMLTGYNMFNIQPQYINPVTKTVSTFNSPVSLSAGITLQL